MVLNNIGNYNRYLATSVGIIVSIDIITWWLYE